MGATTHAFAILDAVCRSGSDGIPFADIVRDTSLPKASVHRLVKELVVLGALEPDERTRRYRAGILLARLGAAVSQDLDPGRIAQPHLETLQKTTGHVATFGILENGKGIYAAKVEPSGFGIKLHSEIGRPFPLHCTGMGKIMLAYGPGHILQNLPASTLEHFTDKTITDKKALTEEINRIRSAGYALDAEEITTGLTCVAAPVPGQGGQLLGAISCTFMTALEDEAGISEIVKKVQSTAHAIAADLLATFANAG